MNFWMGAAGCVIRCEAGSETELACRLAGRVQIPADVLRRVPQWSRAERCAWWAKQKGLEVSIVPNTTPLGAEHPEGRWVSGEDEALDVDTPEGEHIEYRKPAAVKPPELTT